MQSISSRALFASALVVALGAATGGYLARPSGLSVSAASADGQTAWRIDHAGRVSICSSLLGSDRLAAFIDENRNGFRSALTSHDSAKIVAAAGEQSKNDRLTLPRCSGWTEVDLPR